MNQEAIDSLRAERDALATENKVLRDAGNKMKSLLYFAGSRAVERNQAIADWNAALTKEATNG